MASFRREADHRRSRMLSLEEKWKILFNQQTRPSLHSAQMYCGHLQKVLESMSGCKQKAAEDGDSRPVSYLLRKLKVDLQMSFPSFVQEFISKPLEGLGLLLTLLKNVQKSIADLARTPAKVKAQNTKKLLTDEHDCLLCIKFALREQEATSILLEKSYGLETVASALMSSFTKSRLVALEIMSLVLTDPKGLTRNLDCFTYFRLKNCEPARFRFLISMLMASSAQNLTFQVCCMKFFNALLAATPDMNTKVFLQNEIVNAGLDVNALLQCINHESSLEYVELERQSNEFKENLIDINAMLEYRSSLEMSYSELQQQVSILQVEVESMKNNSCQDSANSSTTSQNVSPVSAAVVPDPPPPPPCIGTARRTSRPNVDFPFLHWKPLHIVKNTIFQTLDGESILSDKEIEEFEEAFKLKPVKPLVALRRKTVSTKQANKRRFLEWSRSQNLLIAKKKIGLTAEGVKKALDEYDYNVVDADNAELLLRFVPTERELQEVMELTCNYDDLAEAEQLMVQLVSVPDLEGKLNCLEFMSQFQEKIDAVEPELSNILTSATSLVNCSKIKKVFQVILFLGNYINSRKQECAPGFHLSSLSKLQDLKSSDKKQTFIDFLVQTIIRRFPGENDWFMDVNLRPVGKGNFGRLSAVVKELEDGMKTVRDHLQLNSGSCGQRLTTFYKVGEEQLFRLQRAHNEAKEAYKNICSMFGENFEEIDPSEFFGHFTKFAKNYKTSQENLDISYRHVSKGSRDSMGRKQYEAADASKLHSNLNPASNSTLELPRYINDIDSGEDEVSYYDITDIGHLREENISEPNKLMCDCCFQETGICNLDPYGHFPSKSTGRVENWILSNNKALLANVRDQTYDDEVPPDYDDDDEINNNDRKVDSESYDSAFGGSDANALKLSGQSSQEDTKLPEQILPRTSTPYALFGVMSSKSQQEPVPDYSVCNSPTGSIRSGETYCSELSRILNEFESNLNKYDSEDGPKHRRFYTMKSIIYL